MWEYFLELQYTGYSESFLSHSSQNVAFDYMLSSFLPLESLSLTLQHHLLQLLPRWPLGAVLLQAVSFPPHLRSRLRLPWQHLYLQPRGQVTSSGCWAAGQLLGFCADRNGVSPLSLAD